MRLIEYELIVFAVCYAIVSLLLHFLIGPVLDDDHAHSRIQIVIFNLLIEDVLFLVIMTEWCDISSILLRCNEIISSKYSAIRYYLLQCSFSGIEELHSCDMTFYFCCLIYLTGL